MPDDLLKRKSLQLNNKNVALVKSYTPWERQWLLFWTKLIHIQKYLARAGLYRGTLWPDYKWPASEVFPDNPHRTDSCTHTSLPVWMTASWGWDSPRHLWISLQSQVNRMIYNLQQNRFFFTCIELKNLLVICKVGYYMYIFGHDSRYSLWWKLLIC